MGWLLVRPWLWTLPLLAQAALVAAVVLGGLAVGGLLWPGQTAEWYWPKAMASIGAGAASVALLWVLLAPVVCGWVFERLAQEVLRERGLASVPRGFLACTASAAVMTVATLPERLWWILISLAASVLGPFAPLVSAYGIARVATLDAFDIALSARDPDHRSRREGLDRHQADRRLGAIGAWALKLLLMPTGVGLLLWMPAVVCGAARRVADRVGERAAA